MGMYHGCKYRAHLFSKYLTKHLKKNFPRKKFDLPKRHFIFGELAYQTDNARLVGFRRRVVDWGFHVVPMLKLSGNENHNIFGDMIRGYVTCESNTYHIEDDCFAPDNVEKSIDKDDERLLDLEWDLQEELGRDPEIVLGDRYQEAN